jgi:hypothetical protein
MFMYLKGLIPIYPLSEAIHKLAYSDFLPHLTVQHEQKLDFLRLASFNGVL